MGVKTVDRIVSVVETRQLVSEWTSAPVVLREFETLWAALRYPNDIKPSFSEFEQYKEQVQLACGSVPATVFPPTHQNFEQFGRFNEASAWEFRDRKVLLFLVFSEHDVSISVWCWPKP